MVNRKFQQIVFSFSWDLYFLGVIFGVCTAMGFLSSPRKDLGKKRWEVFSTPVQEGDKGKGEKQLKRGDKGSKLKWFKGTVSQKLTPMLLYIVQKLSL